MGAQVPSENVGVHIHGTPTFIRVAMPVDVMCLLFVNIDNQTPRHVVVILETQALNEVLHHLPYNCRTVVRPPDQDFAIGTIVVIQASTRHAVDLQCVVVHLRGVWSRSLASSQLLHEADKFGHPPCVLILGMKVRRHVEPKVQPRSVAYCHQLGAILQSVSAFIYAFELLQKINSCMSHCTSACQGQESVVQLVLWLLYGVFPNSISEGSWMVPLTRL